ncbi:unnamed protein product [Rhodiola kirilowii]
MHRRRSLLRISLLCLESRLSTPLSKKLSALVSTNAAGTKGRTKPSRDRRHSIS